MLGLAASIAAIIAALGMIVPELLRLAAAQQTGVITRKGYAKTKVDRTVDKDAFRSLVRTRYRNLLVPVIILAVGLFFTTIQLQAWVAIVKANGH